MSDKTNMNGADLYINYPNIKFESDEDAMKISLFYFIELVMIGREMRQHMGLTMLGLIDDLEDFINYDLGELI